MLALQKISAQRPRLADQVHAQILEALRTGSISPSERLHQERLAEMLDVSRTPVREALLRLEQEGILISAAKGGFEIRQITDRDVVEMYRAREAVEGYCAGQLAQDKSAEALARLREIVEREETRSLASATEYYDANRAIHRAIVAETGNAYLLEMFDSMWSRAFAVQVFSRMSDRALALTLSGHEALCDEIASGSFDRARAAMTDHIRSGLALQIESLRSS